jgi:integrase
MLFAAALGAAHKMAKSRCKRAAKTVLKLPDLEQSVAPHDLRRTCARLCHQAGGEVDQIQFLLGHVSIQTTERYLGCKQRFCDAVNDHIGMEPDAPS